MAIRVEIYECHGCGMPYYDPYVARACCPPQRLDAWDCGTDLCDNDKTPRIHETEADAKACWRRARCREEKS